MGSAPLPELSWLDSPSPEGPLESILGWASRMCNWSQNWPGLGRALPSPWNRNWPIFDPPQNSYTHRRDRLPTSLCCFLNRSTSWLVLVPSGRGAARPPGEPHVLSPSLPPSVPPSLWFVPYYGSTEFSNQILQMRIQIWDLVVGLTAWEIFANFSSCRDGI